jgi:cytochrome oxidase Cu insertion factor (SCO1/SenC/PrrC family)
MARGPLLALLFEACPKSACQAIKTKAARMTSPEAVRYKFVREEKFLMDINDKAPEFSLPDQNGEKVSLKDFRGKTVVLFFFPKADTPG